jgi:hypothetical protein
VWLYTKGIQLYLLLQLHQSTTSTGLWKINALEEDICDHNNIETKSSKMVLAVPDGRNTQKGEWQLPIGQHLKKDNKQSHLYGERSYWS